MGCTASSDQDIQRLKQQLQENETKHHEQLNLLRFKIEVLVNMLSVEEKRGELTTKRVETLKWLLQSHGMTEEKLTEIIQKIENAANGNEDNVRSSFEKNQILVQQRLLDMQGALARMREEFDLFKKEIIHGFAYTDGINQNIVYFCHC